METAPIADEAGAVFASANPMNFPTRPLVVAFDVVETLFSLEVLRPKMEALGLAPQALEAWFASLLRDAFALTVTEKYAQFADLARGGLQEQLAEIGRVATDDEIQNVLDELKRMPAQSDVRQAFEMLQGANVRILTVSNGAKQQTEKLLEGANLTEFVEQVISTDEVGRFKPHRMVYEHTVRVAGVKAGQIALVAAHGWDVHGAACAGLTTGWVERREKRFPQAFEGPNISGGTLVEVARGLLALPLD